MQSLDGTMSETQVNYAERASLSSPSKEVVKRKDRFKNLRTAVRSCFSPIFPRAYEPGINQGVSGTALSNIPLVSSTNCHERHSSSRCVSAGFALMGYTFVLQLGLHLTTFLLHALTFRRLDTTSLGLVNVRLGLFYSTLMFVARDAFRRACLSRGGELKAQLNSGAVDTKVNEVEVESHSELDHKGNARACIAELLDLAWMILPLGTAIASVLLVIWMWLLPSPESLVEVYGETSPQLDLMHQRYINCLLVYALSGLLELATEPFWLVCQLSHLVRERIYIEGLANGARALGILIAVSLAHPDYAVYSLALPQILHGTSLFVSYLVYFRRFLRQQQPEKRCIKILHGINTLRDLFPKFHDYSVDQQALDLMKSFFGQGLLKQLLTEGERYLVSAFPILSFTDQGIYDMINSIGSIAIRLLFLPMEESCHFVFNQCLTRNVPPSLQDPVRLDNVFRIFKTVLRACSLLAWIGITFAPANSQLMLFAYAGSAIASNLVAVRLLRLYAFYVLLLAWNGSTEAFLNAAMSSDEVSRHNKRLIFFSVVFLSANWLLVPWMGAYGFLVANCINMLCRITYSLFYINRFLHWESDECCSSSLTTPNRSAPMRESSPEKQDTLPSNVVPGRHLSLLALMFPSSKECLVLILCLVVTLFSESFLCCSSGILLASLHALITALSLGITMYIMYCEEFDLINTLRDEILHLKST